jgi:hypothetical protein
MNRRAALILGTKLDLLHLDDGLLSSSLGCLLLFLVLVLSVVEDLADRRLRLGIHLD